MEASTRRDLSIVLVAGAIVLAALAAYHNSFSVPFLFDDEITVETNPSIRDLGSLGAVLSPPADAGSAGRPFLNLTFALNYAMGGLSVEGYHVLSLLIHALAGITLFGIARNTLALPQFKKRYGDSAVLLGSAVAILWILNPVQTESVTYITQRAESLMGFFYLLTLYFFIRSAKSARPAPCALMSIAACACGMMSKEVMVSAPLVVFLYDRIFIAGSFRGAWRQRWGLYLGLAATWLLLAAVMANSNLHRRSVGYGDNFTWWTYGLTESKVVVDYLKLAVWPHPLVFDYGPDLRVSRAAAAPYLLILFLLIAATLTLLRRWPSLGFVSAWFFLILAPTSSIVPLAEQPMAEHRLYLSSAAVVVLEVIGLYSCLGRKGFLIAFPALALIFGILTIRRNSDYADATRLWTDTVVKQPGNARAQNNLGNALLGIPDRLPEAIGHFEEALRINPSFAEAHNNLGNALSNVPERSSEAIAQLEAALKLYPDYMEAHNNLGNVLSDLPGRLPEAIAHYEAALRIKPTCAEAHNNLGNALMRTPGRQSEAITHYEAAITINPGYAEAHNNLGNALANIPGRLREAIAQYETALRLNPDDNSARVNLQIAIARLGHL